MIRRYKARDQVFVVLLGRDRETEIEPDSILEEEMSWSSVLLTSIAWDLLVLSSSTCKEAIVEIDKTSKFRFRDPTATDVLYRGGCFLGHLEKNVDGSRVRPTTLIFYCGGGLFLVEVQDSFFTSLFIIVFYFLQVSTTFPGSGTSSTRSWSTMEK